MLKASLSFVLLLAGVVSAISADYADAKNVAANFSQPRQTVSQCGNQESGQVSELVFRGTGFKPAQYGCNPSFEDCRPVPSSLPPAFAPPQIAPAAIAPAPIVSAVSDVTNNMIGGLFGLVVACIGATLGGLKGNAKGKEEDEQYAAKWAAVRKSVAAPVKKPTS